MAIKHVKVVTTPDDGTSEVGTDEWNDDHTIENNTVTNDHLVGSIAQSKITNLTTDISSKAPIASPTFTGTVAIPNVADLETAVVANTAKVGLTDNSVTLEHLAHGTAGKLIGFNASTGVPEEQDAPSSGTGLLFTHETSGYTNASSISKTQTTGNFNWTDNGYSVVNPLNAFDGSGSTYATANSLWNGGDGWIIDFGRVHFGVTLNYYASYSHNGYNNGLMLKYSTDGSSWTTAFNGHNSTINQTLWSPDSTVANIDVRYLQAVASGTNGYVNAQIRKFYLTGTPTGSQLTQTGNYGTTKYMSGVSITPNSPLDMVDNTLLVKTSTNNSTWTLNRTIAKTELTAGSANYIRMNPVDARYVKLEGDSGGVMEVGTVQSVYEQNDNAYMIKNHNHNSIDTTDSSLGLDGT